MTKITAKVYENKGNIVVAFGRDSTGEYHATEISKSSLGASCGFSFDNYKDKRKYIKKHKMRFVGTFEITEFKWKK